MPKLPKPDQMTPEERNREVAEIFARVFNHVLDEMELLALEKHAVKDNADVSRILKTQRGELDESGDFSVATPGQDGTPSDPTELQKIIGGKLVALKPDESLDSFQSNRPSPTFTGFLEHLRRDSALGMIPFEFAADSSKVGGAGVRLVVAKAGPGIPGQSSFTFEARAHLPNSNCGDLTASATKTMQPWCAYEFQFWCEVSGGCHEGVGWVTIRSPGGTILYEGCPSQGVLGMGNTTITAGTDITVQYSQSNGPCPGGHQCDAAVFRVELAHGGSRVVLGTANLNNGNDGGDRGPFTFTITQAMLDSLATP